MKKASALVRFDYADRYFLLSHLKRFGRRVCQILLGPIMWSCYVLRLSPNLDFTETVAQSDQGGGQIFEMLKWHLKHQRR